MQNTRTARVRPEAARALPRTLLSFVVDAICKKEFLQKKIIQQTEDVQAGFRGKQEDCMAFMICGMHSWADPTRLRGAARHTRRRVQACDAIYFFSYCALCAYCLETLFLPCLQVARVAFEHRQYVARELRRIERLLVLVPPVPALLTGQT